MKDEFLLEMLHSGGGSFEGVNSFTISDPRQVIESITLYLRVISIICKSSIFLFVIRKGIPSSTVPMRFAS